MQTGVKGTLVEGHEGERAEEAREYDIRVELASEDNDEDDRRSKKEDRNHLADAEKVEVNVHELDREIMSGISPDSTGGPCE